MFIVVHSKTKQKQFWISGKLPPWKSKNAKINL
jgi:hypothetical protein